MIYLDKKFLCVCVVERERGGGGGYILYFGSGMLYKYQLEQFDDVGEIYVLTERYLDLIIHLHILHMVI
jgi:hypothetical protein